jgi:hypothetical protein
MNLSLSIRSAAMGFSLLFSLALAEPYIPRSNPPLPVMTDTGEWTTGNLVVTNWVYMCEYQTNVHGFVTETRIVTVTNTVDAQQKMLAVRIERATDLVAGDWAAIGATQYYTLDGSNGTFRARLEIK